MEIFIPSSKCLLLSATSPLFSNVNLAPAFLSYRTKPLPPKPIVFAKWKRRRSRSRKPHPISLESLAFLASNLRILPEPWDFIIREFGGGNGSGRFGFGGGGFGGWGSRGGRKLGFWAILVVSGILLLCVVLDEGKGRDLTWAAPILLAMMVYCLVGCWKREIRGWLLGFSCGASMVGLGLQKENLLRLNQRIRSSYRNSNPIEVILRKTVRRRR